MIKRGLLGVLCAFLFIGCAKDHAKEIIPVFCDTLEVTYTLQVADILNTNCALPGCHDAATATFGVDLASYDAAVNSILSADVDILCAIKQDGSCFFMPPIPEPPLKQSDIVLVECWIENGMPE
jgi:hypothetical protein